MWLTCRYYVILTLAFAVQIAWASPETSLRQIRDHYTKIRSHHALTPAIDGQRFIAPATWQYIVASGENQPWRVFGDHSFSNWMNTARWIQSGQTHSVQPIELYDLIEEQVMKGHYFRGYEIRRIQHAAATDSIPQAYAQTLIKKIEDGEEIYFSGTQHSELVAKYRWHPLDEFEHNGELFDERGQRYLTRDEVAAAQMNPLLKVDHRSLVDLGQGRLRGRILYPRIKDLPNLVSTAFKNYDDSTRADQSLQGQVRAILKLQRDLITIHRSLDGNGRSIRLLADALFLRLGLPPPLQPIEYEMFMSLEELFEKTLAHMERYLEVVDLALYRPTLPTVLYHWTTEDSFLWMATEGAKGPIPMQTISESSRLALNHPVLANQPGTHVWPNPYFSLRGGGMAQNDDPDQGFEWYAKPNKKNVLIAYSIKSHARIKTLRTFTEEDRLARSTKTDFQGFDLIYHQHLNPDQTLAFHEWIILNPEIVDHWTGNAHEVIKILEKQSLPKDQRLRPISFEHLHFMERSESEEIQKIEAQIWEGLMQKSRAQCEFLLGA